MAGIRSRDTRPELVIRKGLHALGYRYRLHSATLPGKPDIVLARHQAVILVHGCFWHGHDCHLFRLPATRPEFWASKLERNRQRDAEVRRALRDQGWRLLVIWECALKGRLRLRPEDVLARAAGWIERGGDAEEIAGGPG